MDVKCPQHDHLLATQEIILRIGEKDFHCIIGLCPQCNVRYINRQFFKSCNTFHLDGTAYQYLKKLRKSSEQQSEQPTDAPTPQRIASPSTSQQPKMTKAAKLAQKEAIRAAEIKQKKLRIEEEKRKTHEAAILQTKDRILSGEYKLYHAKSVRFVKKIPSTCPMDGDELLDIKNTCFNMHGRDIKTAAHCCIRCGTAYLLEKRKNQFLPKRPPKISQNTILINENEVSSLIAHSKIQTRDSAIVEAKIRRLGDTNIQTITVVTSPEDQSSKDGIYWIGRNMSAAVLFAIQIDPKCRFEYKGFDYEVVSYKGSRNLHKYLRIISRFCDPVVPRTIHIFAHKNILKFQSDDYEAVTAMIPCASKIFPVATTVYYEKKTSRYFINEDTYKSLRDSYGLPHLRLRAAADVVSFGSGFATLKPNSELNLLGYNVNAVEGLTTAERRKKLGNILDSGVLRKVEVMNHIEWCIKSHQNIPNHENAVSKWKEDLLFVQKYKADSQRIVWIKNIQSKFSERKPL